MGTSRYLASKKRLLLSWLIDLLFFITLWVLLSYFFGFDKNVPFWVPYLLFIIIRTVSRKYFGSIGYFFLGIDKESKAVNSDIFENENWLTISLGMLFILEGTKQLVRWIQIFVPIPYFGVFPDTLSQVMIFVTFGIYYIFTGYWFLKLNSKGFYLGLFASILTIVSTLLSWKLWNSVAEQMVIVRREFQGVPVRPQEIEFMKLLFPEGILIAAGLAFLMILFTFKRFKNA